MSVRDRLLATLVAALWGLNFLVVRFGLDHYPPLFLSALRYVVLALPVVLFVPRPKASLRWLLVYGMGFGVLQFGLLFLAIDMGMPAGQASVVVQAAAPFTMLLGVLLMKERVSRRQLGGAALAVLGLTAFVVERANGAALLPLVLTLLSALGWAVGNLAGRQARPDNPLHFALWMSVIPPLPLLLWSGAMEGWTAGWQALGESFSGDGWPGLLALLYIALAGSVIGSGIWTALLKRNEASTVAPFAMLEPVVGVAAAWLVLDERLSVWALAGGTAVVAGVLVGSTTRAPAGRPPKEHGRPEPADGPRPPAGQSEEPTGQVQNTQRS